ncbi:MAG TPA: hypothetical protein VMB34_12320 [Acetobacteraceae bacterium]|nr:hypothetical protein [Acetobacteraceae bacterium]
MITAKRIAAIGAVAGLAALGVTALPSQANAWWRGPAIGIGVWVPPVVIAPAPVYVPPPVYYAPPPAAYYPPPHRAWVPAHWENGYWVAGHWV